MRKILNNLYKLGFFKRIVPSFLKIFIKIFKKNEIIVKHKKIFLNLNLFDTEVHMNKCRRYLNKNFNNRYSSRIWSDHFFFYLY